MNPDLLAPRPEPDRDDAIAMSMAAGVPREWIVAQYGLASQRELDGILAKPRVQANLAGYRAQVEAEFVWMGVKRRIMANLALDQLYEHIQTASIHDPKAIDTRKWAVDGETRGSGGSSAAALGLDAQVLLQLANYLAQANQGIAAANEQRIIEIEPGDKHLFSGQKFIEDRDRANMEAPSGDERG